VPEAELYAPAFYLADHAAVESGKVYSSGAFWNRLSFPAFPAVLSFSVVAVIHVPWHAYHQQHSFEVWFDDADGRRLPAGFGGEFQVGAGPEMKRGEPTIMPLAAQVGNFVFDQPGEYSAVLSVDGTELSRWAFRVTQALPPAPHAAEPPPTSPAP